MTKGRVCGLGEAVKIRVFIRDTQTRADGTHLQISTREAEAGGLEFTVVWSTQQDLDDSSDHGGRGMGKGKQEFK